MRCRAGCRSARRRRRCRSRRLSGAACRAVMPAARKRGAVHPDAVAGRVREHDRMIRRDGVEACAVAGSARRASRCWSQPAPRIHAPARRSAMRSATRRTASATVGTPLRSTDCIARPVPSRCAWLSVKPGRTRRPPASSVSAPDGTFASARAPTNDEAAVADDRGVGVRRLLDRRSRCGRCGGGDRSRAQ